MSTFGALQEGIQIGKENIAKRRQEERVVRQQRRQELMTEINSITALMNNKNVPDEAKKDLWNGRYSKAHEELFGKPIVPEISAWEKSLGQFTKETNAILHDQSFDRKTRRSMYAAKYKEAGNDPAKLAVMQSGQETLTKRAFDDDVSFRLEQEGKRKEDVSDEDAEKSLRLKQKPNAGSVGLEVQRLHRLGAPERRHQETLGVRKEELGLEREKFEADQGGNGTAKMISNLAQQGTGQAGLASQTGQAGTGGFQISDRDLRLATGPVSLAKQYLSNVFGFAIPGSQFKETIEAREKIKLFNQKIIQTLANNPKIPVAEAKVIRDFLPNPAALFKDPDEAIVKIDELRTFLETERANKLGSIQRGSVGKSTFEDYLEQINAIDAVLKMIPRQGSQQQGITVEAINNMTLQDINNINLAEAKTFSHEVIDAIEQKLAGGR